VWGIQKINSGQHKQREKVRKEKNSTEEKRAKQDYWDRSDASAGSKQVRGQPTKVREKNTGGSSQREEGSGGMREKPPPRL